MASFSEFAGNYLKGTDLQGREWPVTVERITEEEVGDDTKPKLVAYFVGRRKTLPLNKGHISVLSQAFGDNPDNCRGVNIIIFPEQTRTPSGQPAVGVRIKLPHLAAAPPPQQAYAPAPSANFAPNAKQRAQQAPEPEPESLAEEMDDEIPF